jgi:beta-glucosidase
VHRIVVGIALVAACSGGSEPKAIDFGTIGPLAGDGGKGSWRFGVSTAATQIEDMNPETDWYAWTEPVAQGGLGKGTFIGDATKGFSMVDTDVALLGQLGVDSYRFSIEWARIEPEHDVIDETAIQHYRAELGALRAMGIRPLVMVHYFSSPIWTDDPHDPSCTNGPLPTNLCGLGSPGGAQIVTEMGQHAQLLAQRFGDLVDEWGTVNEPIVYLLAAYGAGQFPPGKVALGDITDIFVPALRDYLAAHAAIYHALKQYDTVDADGDGVAASVGLTMAIDDWEPARANMTSQDPDDIAAQQRVQYLFHYLFIDAARTGAFDANLDGTPDEQHPEWAGTIDWLGVQYYFRAGVSAEHPLLLGIAACTSGFDLGSCLPAPDPSYCVPEMGYEGWLPGVTLVLHQLADRYPDLPLVVTEMGIASASGRRRAENLVRGLEAIAKARDEGVDVRGYYHFSLTDSWDWTTGYGAQFGLYGVDYTNYARTPTDAVPVLQELTGARVMSSTLRATYGGTGPMTLEPGWVADPFCTKP